ncbi:MAG: hypothetical protein ACEPOW_02010 [Bacteroidales bacterium]
MRVLCKPQKDTYRVAEPFERPLLYKYRLINKLRPVLQALELDPNFNTVEFTNSFHPAGIS